MNDKEKQPGRIAKIKAHVKEHKREYLLVTAGVLAGCLVTSVAVTLKLSENGEVAPQIQQLMNFGPTNARVINLIERSTPSKPVHLMGTDLYFDSISDAARKTGHSLQSISKQINGHISNVDGDVFEVLQPA